MSFGGRGGVPGNWAKGAMLTDAEVASGATGAVGGEVKHGLPDGACRVEAARQSGFAVPGVKVGRPSADIRGGGGKAPRRIPRIVKLLINNSESALCCTYSKRRASRHDDPYRVCN